MKRTQNAVAKMVTDTGHSGWIRVVMGVVIILTGAFIGYGSDVVQYWALEDASGTTATNAVAGGNAGTLVNFAGGGWDADTPTALSHSAGSLAFNSASSQYVNGGHIGISSTNHGATVSVWLKTKSLITDMRLWGQLRQTNVSPHPMGAISLVSDTGGLWSLKGFSALDNKWFSVMPYGLFQTNVWQHYTFVWSKKQLVTYLNGNPVGGMNHIFEFDRDTQNNAMNFGIGAKYLNSYGSTYDGKMDDLAVWDESLTAEQVRQLSTGVSPLSVAAQSVPTVPAAPLVEYRMDGSAQDSRGNYPGTVDGSAAFTNGVGNTPFSYAKNAALWLDGSSGRVSIADAVALRPGTNAWTVSLWFKTSVTNQFGSLITKRMNTAQVTQMSLLMGGAGTGNPGVGQQIHSFVIGSEGSAKRWEAASSGTYADGIWHHLALVRSVGDWRPMLYVDGAATAIKLLYDTGMRPHDVNCTDPWTIGTDTTGSSFSGLIDEVAMWNTALPSEQIAWLSQNSLTTIDPAPVMPKLPLAEYRMDGNALDTRGQHPGTVAGDAAFVSGSTNTPFSYAGNAALQLDGIGDYMSIADAVALRPGTNAFTLSFWFKTAITNRYSALVSKRLNGQPYTQLSLMLGGTVTGNPGIGQKIHPFIIGTQTSVDRWEAVTRLGYADGEWHHVALVRSTVSRSPILYVDGVMLLVDTLYDTGARPHNINCTVPWTIGNDGIGNYFAGLIDEVAMWNAVLPSEQIAWLAQNSLSSIPRMGTILMIQ